MGEFVHPMSYLSNNSTDVSQQSNSRSHIIPHLLSTKVNLHAEDKSVVSVKSAALKILKSFNQCLSR